MIEHKPDRGDPAAERAEMQQEFEARSWRRDERMEAVLARLERDPDDPMVDGTMRMSIGYYTSGKASATGFVAELRRQRRYLEAAEFASAKGLDR